MPWGIEAGTFLALCDEQGRRAGAETGGRCVKACLWHGRGYVPGSSWNGPALLGACQVVCSCAVLAWTS
jgi:hypothetical protein